MKKLLVVFIVLSGFAANAQQNSRSNFGLTANAGLGKIIRASSEGIPELDLQRNFGLGAYFFMPIAESLTFETGIVYNYFRLTQKAVDRPDVPQITTLYDVQLLYLPAFIRINASENFFINGGVLADVDLSNPLGLSSSKTLNSQSGLGAGMGIGGEFKISPAYYLQINPYLNYHGLLLLKKEENPATILDYGLKIGIRTKR